MFGMWILTRYERPGVRRRPGRSGSPTSPGRRRERWARRKPASSRRRAWSVVRSPAGPPVGPASVIDTSVIVSIYRPMSDAAASSTICRASAGRRNSPATSETAARATSAT
jgi:hypothetical protein